MWTLEELTEPPPEAQAGVAFAFTPPASFVTSVIADPLSKDYSGALVSA